MLTAHVEMDVTAVQSICAIQVASEFLHFVLGKKTSLIKNNYTLDGTQEIHSLFLI